MANVVYFSHSYRAQDAGVNAYFGRLLETENLTPSLDPPSDAVNSAKLERHLNYSDGMVAVLTEREGGVSPHILYEITLAIRSRKPLVVFVEDSLPNGILPSRLLQQRFSRRSFLRQMREHRQALRSLRSYLGEQAAPRYQPSTSRRLCLVMQADDLPDSFDRGYIQELVQEELRYEPILVTRESGPVLEDRTWWDLVSAVDVVLALHGEELHPRDAYVLGAIRGALRPLITMTTFVDYPYSPHIPIEYQPRQLRTLDLEHVREMVIREFGLYEEDFLDFENQEEVTRYAEQLLELDGYYPAGTREEVRVNVMGDQYNVSGQAGAVGPKAHVHDVNFNQLWAQSAGAVDLPRLTAELQELRDAARTNATTPEEDAAVAEIGQAQLAAEMGDGPKALSHLAKSGQWALSVAQSIGVGVAVGAIKVALGL